MTACRNPRELFKFCAGSLALAFLCMNGFLFAVASDKVVLKKQSPKFDHGSSGSMLNGRIEQIASAGPGTKVLILPTAVTRPELKKQSPWSQKGKVESSEASQRSAKLGTRIDANMPSADLSAMTAKGSPRNSVVASVSKGDLQGRADAEHVAKVVGSPELAKKPGRAFINTILRSDSSYWGGDLKLVSDERLQTDRTLRALIAVGETGSVVFRFLKGAKGTALLQPTMIFFDGRDIPFPECLEEQKFGDGKADKNQDRSGTKLVADLAHFLGPLSFLIPVAPEHLRFTYVSLGDCHSAYNEVGNRFYEETLKNSMTALGDDAVEQDVVSKLSARAPGSLVTYREVVVRLMRNDDNNAFAKVARVDYAADGTIVRRCMYEGWLSTDCGKAAEKICKYTGKPWQETACEYGL